MNKYIPMVGDRIRGEDWISESYVDVEYVGRSWLMGVNRGGHEGIWHIDGEWIKVEKPEPLLELWITQFTKGVSIHLDDPARRPPRFGEVLIVTTHLIPNGDGYRVEVERHDRNTTPRHHPHVAHPD